MSTDGLNALIQAVEQADAKGEPRSFFDNLPESAIWSVAVDLLNHPDYDYRIGPTLIQGISDAFPTLVDKVAASQVLLSVLHSQRDSLTYESAVLAVLRYASHWDATLARRFSTMFVDTYRATIIEGDIFVAGTALDAMIRLPLYRGDDARLMGAIALVIDEFPPVPIDPADAALLPTLALKLLGQCYDYQPLPVIADYFRHCVGHSNYAFDAEARFNLGLVRLYEAFEADDDQEFYEALSDAEAQFARATTIEENRSDAELFRAVTRCFLVMGPMPTSSNITELVRAAQNLLQERLMAFGGAASERRIALEYAVVSLTDALDRWAGGLVAIHQAPSLIPPLSELALLYSAVREMSAVPGLPGLASEVGQARIMLPALRGRFAEVQEIRAKLTTILNDSTLRESLSSVERDFYELALEELWTVPDPKSAAAARLDALRTAAKQLAPAFARQIEDLFNRNNSVLSRYSVHAKGQWWYDASL